MSITRDAMKIVEIANEKCKEKNIDIKKLIEEDPQEFSKIFKEATYIFEKINLDEKEIESEKCKMCIEYEERIEALESLTNKKKVKSFKTFSEEATIVGLEMALTILK